MGLKLESILKDKWLQLLGISQLQEVTFSLDSRLSHCLLEDVVKAFQIKALVYSNAYLSIKIVGILQIANSREISLSDLILTSHWTVSGLLTNTDPSMGRCVVFLSPSLYNPTFVAQVFTSRTTKGAKKLLSFLAGPCGWLTNRHLVRCQNTVLWVSTNDVPLFSNLLLRVELQ